MDAHVQFLLHHLWPSPAAIKARLPHTSAPGFTAGQHDDASVFASCYSLQSCSPLDQVTPLKWHQRLLPPGFPHFRSPQSEVGYNYTANWTLAVVGLCGRTFTHWQSAFMGCTDCLLSSSVFRLRHGFTPSVINRASGFLRREAFICLERTSIRAGPFLPDGSAGERVLTELWIFRQFASGACFYRKSVE